MDNFKPSKFHKQSELGDTAMEMPAGKYKGMSVEDVPNGYLEWLLKELPHEKNPALCSAMQTELNYREKYSVYIGENDV